MSANQTSKRLLVAAAADALALVARLLTAPRVTFHQSPRAGRPAIFYANHTSNADTVLLWAALPPKVRRRTRPVAAADYWLKTPLRRFFGLDVLGALAIERRPEERTSDPVARMVAALDAGSALIIFPEGRRNDTDARLLPFKTGLYHVARARPGTDIVPVWIENVSGVMPRGEVIPVPLICDLTFGHPLRINDAEGVRWLYSFLSADKRRTFCLYDAPSPEAIRRAAARAGLPADAVVEVTDRLLPDSTMASI